MNLTHTTNEAIRRVIGDMVDAHPLQVLDDRALQSGLGYDSLDLVELQFALEDEFGIQLEDFYPAERRKPMTVRDVIERVHAQILKQ